jgi:uncharacterized protein YndB with AHSA1/START domain
MAEETQMTGKVATATVDIDATPQRVWSALTDPDEIEKYMFGSRVDTDWKPGSPIVWRGELYGSGTHTRVQLRHDNNSSAEEAEHSATNWQTMLDGLKAVVEAD